jgi:hypothetical protein
MKQRSQFTTLDFTSNECHQALARIIRRTNATRQRITKIYTEDSTRDSTVSATSDYETVKHPFFPPNAKGKIDCVTLPFPDDDL